MVDVRGALGVALAAAALILAWVLLAAPAFADARVHSGTFQYVDCDRVQAVAGVQYNAHHSGDVNQNLRIAQEQTCHGDVKDHGVLADTIVKGTLPDTGGLSLPALGAYALVVAGIFSLRSVIGWRR